MLNRRHIRVKVMQSLYANLGGESEDFSKDQKFLMQSIYSMYDLYILLISIFIEVRNKGIDQIGKQKQKHLATKEDKNPNTKFVNNEILKFMGDNELILEKIKQQETIDWDLDSEYIDIIFKAIVSSNAYKSYMKTRMSNFQQDKEFITTVFREVIAPNDKLYDYIEDKNLTWLDDLPTINTTILKLLQKLRPNPTKTYLLPELYRDEDDLKFATDLFTKTLLNQNELNEEIKHKTINWDSERLASIDLVLIQMAICELKHFPSIPVKVTINEYLEIAKEYSTPKSSNFINGILDKLVKEYEADGKLNKVGRGLL
ncbi:transcription antitermination factor NusB [Yeosuana sp. MJ-SS3]|uniref:Transcription antitermination factor NusB n=1 Tax=Gilvirhabdus luticola TaxID=3079858 RepID=A0ABU3U4U9_9FLAO|nr:transcription antitermination factor NusB [Yeosuana sp. MJ-SS3]MDU8885428.1 transcription antitermination factor NusB [Yeosuana sp. MJ-SS3]